MDLPCSRAPQFALPEVDLQANVLQPSREKVQGSPELEWVPQEDSIAKSPKYIFMQKLGFCGQVDVQNVPKSGEN